MLKRKTTIEPAHKFGKTFSQEQNQIIKELTSQLFEVNHIINGSKKIFLNKKIVQILGNVPEEANNSFYMGMRVAGTFDSDICNVIIAPEPIKKVKTIKDYTTEELFKEIRRRIEE